MELITLLGSATVAITSGIEKEKIRKAASMSVRSGCG